MSNTVIFTSCNWEVKSKCEKVHTPVKLFSLQQFLHCFSNPTPDFKSENNKKSNNLAIKANKLLAPPHNEIYMAENLSARKAQLPQPRCGMDHLLLLLFPCPLPAPPELHSWSTDEKLTHTGASASTNNWWVLHLHTLLQQWFLAACIKEYDSAKKTDFSLSNSALTLWTTTVLQ